MRILLPLTCLLAPCFAIDRSPQRVTVHEWGTFTTVADDDGRSVPWRPISPADLPCFVERLTPYSPKTAYATLVRMETPVLYFYAQQPAKISVRVDFPKGLVTEWYPKASALARTQRGGFEWNAVEVLPGETPPLPMAKGASHYFAARETDAAPVRVNGQTEKMLFYRGVGNFQVPVEAKFDAGGRLNVRNTGTEILPVAIYFENRGGKAGYRVKRGLAGTVEWEAPELQGTAAAVQRELAMELVTAGLYSKEAEAMIETWRDSWFEEGTRVFYLVPRAMVDAVLPLQTTPAPAAVERVFVGRVELLAPWREREMLAATEPAPLQALGRFLEPFAGQLMRTSGKRLNDAAYSTAAERVFRAGLAGNSCIQ